MVKKIFGLELHIIYIYLQVVSSVACILPKIEKPQLNSTPTVRKLLKDDTSSLTNINCQKCARGLDGVLVCFRYITIPCPPLNVLSPLTVLPVVRSASHGRRLPIPSPYNGPFLFVLSSPSSYPLRPPALLFLSLILSSTLRPPFFLFLFQFSLYSLSFLLSRPLRQTAPSYSPSPTFLLLHPPSFSFPRLLLYYYYFPPHPVLLSTTTLLH